MLLSPSHTIALGLFFSPSLSLCHLTKQVFPDTFRYFLCVVGWLGPCLHVSLMGAHKDQKRASDPPKLESLMMWAIMLVLETEPGFSATAPNPWTSSPAPRFLNWFSSLNSQIPRGRLCLLTYCGTLAHRTVPGTKYMGITCWLNKFIQWGNQWNMTYDADNGLYPQEGLNRQDTEQLGKSVFQFRSEDLGHTS